MKRSLAQNVAICEAFGMYLITGAACTCVGASMPSLMEHFNVSLAAVAALASAFAFGRAATVFLCGLLTERFGPRLALFTGVAAFAVYLGLMPTMHSYPLALALMALAGMGMGMQDCACPVVLACEFPDSYGSAMSAGQAFFGAGCFLPPLVMSFLLFTGLSWKFMYYGFLIIAAAMLVGFPFMHAGRVVRMDEEAQTPDAEPTPRAPRSRRRIPLFAAVFIADFSYCAILNVFHTYTNSYVMSFGVPESTAVNVLTMFSVGAMIGSIAFMVVLKRLHTTTVLLMNSIIALAALALAMHLKTLPAFFILFTVAGIFSGVIYSVLVTLSTELMPSHAAMAASMVGFVGSSSDILTPLITGAIVTRIGIAGAFGYNLAACIVTSAAAVLLVGLYRREKRHMAEKQEA